MEKLTLNLVYVSKKEGKAEKYSLAHFPKTDGNFRNFQKWNLLFWLVSRHNNNSRLGSFSGVASVQPWHHINPQALRRFEFLRRILPGKCLVDFVFSKKQPAFHFWRFSFVLLLLTKKTHFSVSDSYTEFVYKSIFVQLHRVPRVKPGRFSSCELLRGAFRLAFHADLLGLEGEVSRRRNPAPVSS